MTLVRIHKRTNFVQSNKLHISLQFLIAIETFIRGQLYLFLTYRTLCLSQSYLPISSLLFSIYSPLWVYIGDFDIGIFWVFYLFFVYLSSKTYIFEST